MKMFINNGLANERKNLFKDESFLEREMVSR